MPEEEVKFHMHRCLYYIRTWGQRDSWLLWANWVRELVHLCHVSENRHSFQRDTAPLLLLANLPQRSMDLDAVLNQSYKTLLSSPNRQITLKRSMLRSPPFWTKPTSCLKWFQWHSVWMLKICRSPYKGMWFPRPKARFRKRKENTRDLRSRNNSPPRSLQWPPLKYTRIHMKDPQSHLGDTVSQNHSNVTKNSERT